MKLVATQPFSEHDVLELHDMFMTRGTHQIKVNNLVDGRALVYALLNSLRYYHDVAALTVTGMPLEPGLQDLYMHLIERAALVDRSAVKDFLLAEFYADFLWIEVTDMLTVQPWYIDFKYTIGDLQLDQKMPIIEIYYYQDR